MVKNPPVNAGDTGSIPGSGRSPEEGKGNPLQNSCLGTVELQKSRTQLRRRQWHPTPYSCLENPMDEGAWWAAVHGVAKSQARLSNLTFTFHFSLSCIGEGNGNPLQCSCLENPRHGGAWWAAVYGVAQSRTRLKRLSSSITSLSFKFRNIGLLNVF